MMCTQDFSHPPKVCPDVTLRHMEVLIVGIILFIIIIILFSGIMGIILKGKETNKQTLFLFPFPRFLIFGAAGLCSLG